MSEPSAVPALPWHLARRLATAAEMQRMDAHAIDELGLPGRVLMENAARAVADRVHRLHDAGAFAGPVAVCCGRGNNGGDGYAVARLLSNRGLPVEVIGKGTPAGDDAAANAEAWSHFGPTRDWEGDRAGAEALLARAGALVDAVFGTGLDREVGGAYRDWVRAMDAAPAPVKVAVDFPSGVHADTGAVLGVAVRCTHTVTFQVAKVGCHQWPGAGCAGEVTVADISIPPRWAPAGAPTYLLTPAFARALVPRRRPDAHKGSFGHLLAVAGSAGMGGAAVLAGRAAVKAGAGLVTLAVPRWLQDRYVAAAPELMTWAPEPATGEGERHFVAGHAAPVLEAADGRSAVAMGCGFGRAEETRRFAREVAARCGQPLLIDADGLFGLDGNLLRQRKAPTVITPHPGELSRLCGLSVAELGADRVGHARRLAREWGVVLVLKGAGTVVADPSGLAALHPFADDALASGGTGDVLTGIVGSLLAQRLPALHAALLGVWLHGEARAQQPGVAGAWFSATNLIDGLDPAWRALEGPERP